MTLEDMTSASEIIYDVVDQEANIIVGATWSYGRGDTSYCDCYRIQTNQPLNQKKQIIKSTLYNFSDNKESGASIPEFLR